MEEFTAVKANPVLQKEELLHLFIENAREYAIFAQDANGLIVSWNPGVERILGYDEKSFVGRHVSVVFTPEDVEKGEVEKEIRAATAEQRIEVRRWHVRRDGSRFWANGWLVSLGNKDGNSSGYAKIFRDDTDRKKSEDEYNKILAGERETQRQIERLQQSAERAEQGKDEFLALLAHELRSPLNAILGWVRILRQGMADERQTAKALEIIEESARLQNRLIEDLFDMARISSGKLTVDLRPMSLGEATSQAVELIRPAAKAKNISLETDVGTGTAFILGDPDRIRQAVTNVLSNAVKFTPEGGRVRLGLTQCGSSARLIIEDNGQGIDADLMPHVFDRYAQADKDSARGKAGLGLGLPLARRLVERHGGEIKAESAGAGRGATFTINLPLIEV